MHTVRTVIYTIVFVILVFFIGSAIYMYSGAYDVSARRPEGQLMRWIVGTTREHSIETRARGIVVPSNLDDPDEIMKGFKHYRQMCVGCHRAPGLDPSAISKGLNPRPPDFSRIHHAIEPATAFWVVKNGIRMTAMPAWGDSLNDEQLWTLVAFVKQLHSMTEVQYQALDKQASPEVSGHLNKEEEHGGGAPAAVPRPAN